MNKLYTILFFVFTFFFFYPALSQTPGEWVWLKGDSTPNGVAVYGIQGIPDPMNTPPAMYEACEWTDLNGNFWIFGGVGINPDQYNDLWKYDPLTNEWTWMKGPGIPNDPGSYGIQGVSSPVNNPPYRGWGTTSWLDHDGNFWLFGGRVAGGPFYSDLWKYDPLINEWTWMKGSDLGNQPGIYGTQMVPDPANYPGARSECSSSWTDLAGDLWVFGGYFNGSNRNDLWRYHIPTNEWTWMKGSQSMGLPPVFGIQGVEDPANTPGARHTYTHWLDNNGSFWLTGGSASSGSYNDMWRYNPISNNWTWVNGSNSINPVGNYGSKCVTAITNQPPARYENRAVWDDQDDNFWFFGGVSGSPTYNDLWKYCRAENKWTWVSGSNAINPPGSWGVKGVSNPTNVPHGRDGSVAWYSPVNRQLFLFAGGFANKYNDMWCFTVDTACAPCQSTTSALFSAPNFLCPGTCVDFTNLSANASTYQWTFPGGSPAFSTDVNPQSICYPSPGTYDVTLIATNGNASDTLTIINYISVFPAPPPQGISQSGDTLFSNGGTTSYQWFFNGSLISGATEYFYVALLSGDYNVVCTDSNGCEVEAAIFDVVAANSQLAVRSRQLAIYPNPVVDEIRIHKVEVTRESAFTISVYNVLGEKIMIAWQISEQQEVSLDVSQLPSGVYYIELAEGENLIRAKFIKQ